MKHPIQPLALDEHGVLRFKQNAIVRHLLDHGGIDLNAIACLPFDQEDRQQFAQLIGYSLSGFSELSYVDDDTFGAAEQMFKFGLSEEKAWANHLESELNAVRDGLRATVARLYGIHPDDLGGDE